MKIVVIGSIEAGVSAAMMLASGHAGAQIAVYEKGSFYTCGTCGLPHYLGEDLKTLKQAIDGKEQELSANHIEAHLRHEVLEIQPSSGMLTIRDMDSNRVFSERYDKLVLATGNQCLVPNVPGADRVGVQTLKSVEDLLFLKEFVRTPYVRDIVILGGSYAGLEIAKAFHKLGRNVRIIEKERRILPDFDGESASMIQAELEKAGLTFQLGESVIEFPGQTFVEQVRTSRGTYPCDLCISAIGVVPNTALAASAGVVLDSHGAIVVNDRLETNVPGIYAVGNCTAAGSAALRTSSLRTADLEIARTGLTEEEAGRCGRRVKSVIASGNDRPGICPNPNTVTIKLVYDANTRQVLGAQAWGRKNAAARINAIAVAVAAGMTVEQLGQVGFVYSSSASSIWDPIQIVCSMADKGAKPMAERISAVKTSFFGKGAVRLLIPELQKMGVRRALVITDSFLYESGAASRVGGVLSEAGVEYAVYYHVKPNPTVDIVNECIRAAKKLQVDLLLALGGGSAIDTAKAVSVVLANGGQVEDYEGIDRSFRPGIPIAAVNTTAGTGSECTGFYIVTDPVRHSKMTMVDANCMVSIAVNDIDFMSSMPPKLTAATGMDALTHAVEAVLSKNATPLTDKDAFWAIQTITKYLPRAVADGSDEEARTMMAYAENTAGMAFSNAGLGMVHAMAHALGGRYNLPHGICNAVLLPYVLAFNSMVPGTEKRFEEIARAMGIPGLGNDSPKARCGCGVGSFGMAGGFGTAGGYGSTEAAGQSGSAAGTVIARVCKLSVGIGIPGTLKELKGVSPEDFSVLADLALKDSCMATNPVFPSKEEVVAVYASAFCGWDGK